VSKPAPQIVIDDQ